MVRRETVKKTTAMERLLAEGFFASKEAALPYLMSGAVFCGEEKVRTGGQRVPCHLPMRVRGLNDRYVGKGGYKLEGAMHDFGISAKGRVCIDAGACTGGFTDCLLQHGAQKVYAVEVGFGQLAGSLQQDPRVVNLEKTNIGDERLLSLEPVPTLGSVDLSYLSLVKAVPQFRHVMHGQGELICLVKPLFEIDDAGMRRTGEISAENYAPLLVRLADELSAQEDTLVCALTHSCVTGNHGTHEFFFHIRFGSMLSGNAPEKRMDWKEEARKASACALQLTRYEK